MLLMKYLVRIQKPVKKFTQYGTIKIAFHFGKMRLGKN